MLILDESLNNAGRWSKKTVFYIAIIISSIYHTPVNSPFIYPLNEFVSSKLTISNRNYYTASQIIEFPTQILNCVICIDSSF